MLLPNLKTSLSITFALMGLIAIVLAILTGQVYRELTVESYQLAISDLIKIQTTEQLNDLFEDSSALGLSIQKDNSFRKAYKSNDKKKIQVQLDNKFHQYFVTAGVIRLEKLYVFDKSLNLLTYSSEGETLQQQNDVICNDLISRAKIRKGAVRIKPIDQLCTYGNKTYHAVLVSIGGLIPKGYLLVVSEPLHTLKRIEKSLGFPIQLHYHNNDIAYQSKNWPESERDLSTSLIAEYNPATVNGDNAFRILAVRDLKKLDEKLDKTRIIIILIAVIITVCTALIAMVLLTKTTLRPLETLQHQALKVQQDKEFLGEAVIVNGAPELVSLASGFNQMTSNLKNLYKDLTDSNKQLGLEIHDRKLAEAALQKAHGELENRIKERTAELEQMTKLAETANEAKSDFLSSMSHELRTPLTAILGYAQILASGFNGELTNIQNEHVQHVIQAGNHLLSLINQILDLSRIESGNLDLTLEPLAINDTVEQVISLITPLATARNITIEKKYDKDISYVIRADNARLKQILLNLLSNAVKYNTEKGFIKLEINPIDSEHLKFSVSDTGNGLTKEQQQQLFEPFNRLGYESSNIEGTGIGLTITKKLIECMHGEIGVKSIVDLGTVFWFTLPLIEERQCFNEKPNKTSMTNGIDKDESITAHVLLAEDHKANQDLISVLIKRLGFNIDIASDGRQAVDMWKKNQYDLILMDLNMPNMNGLDATKTIRNLENPDRPTPIIALTANAMKGDMENCIASGMNDYIEKPVDFEKFGIIIKSWLEKTS